MIPSPYSVYFKLEFLIIKSTLLAKQLLSYDSLEQRAFIQYIVMYYKSYDTILCDTYMRHIDKFQSQTKKTEYVAVLSKFRFIIRLLSFVLRFSSLPAYTFFFVFVLFCIFCDLWLIDSRDEFNLNGVWFIVLRPYLISVTYEAFKYTVWIIWYDTGYFLYI